MTSLEIKEDLKKAKTLRAQADYPGAERIYQTILAKDQKNEEALLDYVSMFMDANMLEQAKERILYILSINPKNFHTYKTLGTIAEKLGKHDVALKAKEQAIHKAPNNPNVYIDLAQFFLKNKSFVEAIKTLDFVIRKWPKCYEAYNRLASAYYMQKKFDEALFCLNTSLKVSPAQSEVWYERAHIKLALGDFEAGWKEYEWRNILINNTNRDLHQFAARWEGAPLEGRTLFLYAEQGIGDTFFFSRYIPKIRKKGGKIILQCQKGLKPLMESFPEIDLVLEGGLEQTPDFDVCFPLASFPYAFNTTLETIPSSTPYLKAPHKVKTKKYKDQLERDKNFRVGIIWAGNIKSSMGYMKMRSIGLKPFAEFFDVPGASFYGLQMGEGRDDLENFEAPENFHDFGCEWSETAALIDEMDLIISVDTSVAHLAAALNKPTWVFIPYMSCFRWFIDREDSPWYPTMRLFRQPDYDDWQTPFEKVKDELIKLTTGKRT